MAATALLVQSLPCPPPGSLDEKILGVPSLGLLLARVFLCHRLGVIKIPLLSRTSSRELTFLLLPRPLVATLPNDKFGIL